MANANQKPAQTDPQHDDTDADAFAVLSLLVIIAATIVYYFTH
jgi:hypothetical protein